MHGFRSGGGLRVLTLSKGKKEFYGESGILSEALRILNDDVKAGGREYTSVYGNIEDHYMTGAYSSDNDPVDAWVCSGKKFDISFKDGKVEIDMSEKEDIHIPEPVKRRVFDNQETVYWKIPKMKRMFKSYPESWGRVIGCATQTIPSWSGAESIEERIEFPRISVGDTVQEALENAVDIAIKKFEPLWYEIPYEIGKMMEDGEIKMNEIDKLHAS